MIGCLLYFRIAIHNFYFDWLFPTILCYYKPDAIKTKVVDGNTKIE